MDAFWGELWLSAHNLPQSVLKRVLQPRSISSDEVPAAVAMRSRFCSCPAYLPMLSGMGEVWWGAWRASIHPFIHPSIHSRIHPSMHASIHASMHPSMHASIHPFIHLLNWQYINPCIPPSIHPFIHACIHSFAHACSGACRLLLEGSRSGGAMVSMPACCAALCWAVLCCVALSACVLGYAVQGSGNTT